MSLAVKIALGFIATALLALGGMVVLSGDAGFLFN